MQATSGMILFLVLYGSWKIQTSSVKTVQWGCIVRTVAFWSAPVHLSQIKITTLTIINPKNGLCGTRFLTDSCQIIGYIPLCVYIYINLFIIHIYISYIISSNVQTHMFIVHFQQLAALVSLSLCAWSWRVRIAWISRWGVGTWWFPVKNMTPLWQVCHMEVLDM